jgi:hypothetical protein
MTSQCKKTVKKQKKCWQCAKKVYVQFILVYSGDLSFLMTSASFLGNDSTSFFRQLLLLTLVTHSMMISFFHSSMLEQENSLRLNFIQAHTLSLQRSMDTLFSVPTGKYDLGSFIIFIAKIIFQCLGQWNFVWNISTNRRTVYNFPWDPSSKGKAGGTKFRAVMCYCGDCTEGPPCPRDAGNKTEHSRRSGVEAAAGKEGRDERRGAP